MNPGPNSSRTYTTNSTESYSKVGVSLLCQGRRRPMVAASAELNSKKGGSGLSGSERAFKSLGIKSRSHPFGPSRDRRVALLPAPRPTYTAPVPARLGSGGHRDAAITSAGSCCWSCFVGPGTDHGVCRLSIGIDLRSRARHSHLLRSERLYRFHKHLRRYSHRHDQRGVVSLRVSHRTLDRPWAHGHDFRRHLPSDRVQRLALRQDRRRLCFRLHSRRRRGRLRRQRSRNLHPGIRGTHQRNWAKHLRGHPHALRSVLQRQLPRRVSHVERSRSDHVLNDSVVADPSLDHFSVALDTWRSGFRTVWRPNALHDHAPTDFRPPSGSGGVRPSSSPSGHLRCGDANNSECHGTSKLHLHPKP